MVDTTKTNIGYAKDNDGNKLMDCGMEAFGDMVILENHTKTADPTDLMDMGGLQFSTEIAEHTDIGGWEVVAVGEHVTRVKPGDMVGQPLGNVITQLFHPKIAKREIIDENGSKVVASKKHFDYVYAIVNVSQIGMKYIK